MLCPEVWNFKTPQSNFKTRRGSLNQTEPCEENNKFYYNHLVSVVLPDTVKVPESISESLVKDCDYYKISNISVDVLVNAEFINKFIKKGSLTGFNIDRKIDCDDCASITPSKKLILSLNKETYQHLGLEGKVSHFTKTTNSRYIVSLDLSADYFAPGKKIYERTKTCLRKLQDYTFVFTWEPPNKQVCPSSLAKYFYDLNYDVNLCKPSYDVRTNYSVKVPLINLDTYDLEDADEIVEWVGMLSLSADIEDGSADGFLNTYETPEPNQDIGQVKCLQWRGLFTPKHINQLLEELRNFVKHKEQIWVSLYVQGFSDTPINWEENEHHYYTNGDNGYIILLDSKDKYIMCTNKCSNKIYK